MQRMGAPVGVWNAVVDLTDPLNVEGKPITFRSFDAATVQSHLTAFRAATIETVSRTGLRIGRKSLHSLLGKRATGSGR